MGSGYFSAFGAVALALATAFVVYRLTSIRPLLSFVAAIAFAASSDGVGPGLLALVLSSVATNLFFVEPRFTLSWQMSRILAFYSGALVLALRIGGHV